MRRWWARRTLRDRLALLVSGAVAVALLGLAAMAFVAVDVVLERQVGDEVDAAARTVAAQPERWRAAPGVPPDDDDDDRDDLGTRWQLLAPDGSVVATGYPLPVTEAARRVAAGTQERAEEHVAVGERTYLMLTVPTEDGGAVQVAADEGPSDRTLLSFAAILAAGCVLGVGAAALLGRAVAHTGLAPVRQLTGAVERVAVTMDLSRPVPVRGGDEIARLGRSVNTMLAAIDTSRNAQRMLVEDAGHELRTPLTSLRTNIELLLSVERRPDLAHRLPPQERAQLLRDLDAQIVELSTLTDELVELAREEATRETPEPVDLADVVESAVARVRTRAPEVTFETDLRPVNVHGRPGELERMVLNVLDNAAKWSPAGATVHTVLRGDGTLVVTDNGPGIDAADLPHVFDRFYRAPAARGTPGSGLGLAIVAQTAAQHGGSVTASAHRPQGTVVTIRLPPGSPTPR